MSSTASAPLDSQGSVAPAAGRQRSRFVLAGVPIVVVLVALPGLLAGPSNARLAGAAVSPPAVVSSAPAALAAPGASAEASASPAPPPTPEPVAELRGYAWPLRNPRLTLPFGPSALGSRLVDGQLFHDGVDLATHCGDRIVAAHDGIVLAAGRHFDEWLGWLGDLGPYQARLDAEHLWNTLPIVVVTDDGNGYRSIYAHFSRVVVAAGDTIRRGQLIGYEGATGRATGCHLHFGLFSPLESATFELDPAVAAHLLLPDLMVARVDPLLVLPARGSERRY